MLCDDVERYLSVRQALGFKLYAASLHLRSYALFATEAGDLYVRASTAMEWALQGTSPIVRYNRLRDITLLARFVNAEEPAHEIPNPDSLRVRKRRSLPHIYTSDEISRLMRAADRLSRSYPLRRTLYAVLVGLLVSTGLRISEALALRFSDINPEGVLFVRDTKFRKSRYVPMHPTTMVALKHYLETRCRVPTADEHVFLTRAGGRIPLCSAEYTFQRMIHLAHIKPQGRRRPCIHDLRHTFATRALEKCPCERQAVGRHFVALATYLGHSDIAHTYWYLEATPSLMQDMAEAAAALVRGEEP